VLRYACTRGHLDQGEPRCIAFGGIPVDGAIGRELMRVVQPAAVEAARMAGQEAARAGDEVLAATRRDLEAARYAARRAEKQYHATDPENRLVAQELERRWDQALRDVRRLGQRIAGHQAARSREAVPTREELEGLAAEPEAVWADPDSDARLKKRAVRTLVHEVIADVDAAAGEVVLVVHWKGGMHTELRLPRRRRGQCAATSKDVVQAVRTLAPICSDDAIAGLVNRNGLRPGRGNRWTRQRIISLRHWNHIPCSSGERRRAEGWMNLTEAAAYLGVAAGTLRSAVEQGQVRGERPLPDGPWLFRQRALQTEAAHSLVPRARRRARHPAKAHPDEGPWGFCGNAGGGVVGDLVVGVDNKADAPPGAPQVEEDGGLDALAPQRPPEALALAQRLRVPRPGHHLPAPPPLQL